MSTSTARSRRATSRAPEPTPTKRKASPVLIASIAAVVVGVLIIGALAISGGLPGSGGSSSALQTPLVGTPAALAHGRSLGSANAPIDIQVWADFQCPVCARFTEQIEPYLVTHYVEPGHARLTFHDYAFIGTESLDAAVAARVAEAQAGAFWPMHDLIFANQGAENSGALSRNRLADMAVMLGLDRKRFLTAMDEPTYLAAVQDETSQGHAAGVSATPTMFINGQMVSGLPDLTQLESYLDGLLAPASSAP